MAGFLVWNFITFNKFGNQTELRKRKGGHHTILSKGMLYQHVLGERYNITIFLAE